MKPAVVVAPRLSDVVDDVNGGDEEDEDEEMRLCENEE